MIKEMINKSNTENQSNTFLFFGVITNVKVPVKFNKDRSAFKDLNDGSVHKRIDNSKPTKYFNVEDYVAEKYNVERRDVRFMELNLEDLQQKTANETNFAI